MDGYLGSELYAKLVEEWGEPVREQLQSGLWQVRTSVLDYHYENAGGERCDIRGNLMTTDLTGVLVRVQSSAGGRRLCEVCGAEYQPAKREQPICSRTCEARL